MRKHFSIGLYEFHVWSHVSAPSRVIVGRHIYRLFGWVAYWPGQREIIVAETPCIILIQKVCTYDYDWYWKSPSLGPTVRSRSIECFACRILDRTFTSYVYILSYSLLAAILHSEKISAAPGLEMFRKVVSTIESSNIPCSMFAASFRLPVQPYFLMPALKILTIPVRWNRVWHFLETFLQSI